MFDVCIIGAGGIVGCAITRELAEEGFSVAGIEKHETSCQETSGRNSRVVHSGFHEAIGTLKAELAYEGSRLLIQYAEQRNVPLLRTGMLIAIPHGSIRAGLWKEADALWNLWRRGRAQDIPFRFIVSPNSIRKLAPIEALGGIYIPSVCVIDLEQLAGSLEGDAKAAGAQFLYHSEVTDIAVNGSTFSSPSNTTSATLAPSAPGSLTAWPAGRSGFTVVLESIPTSAGRSLAFERARAASRAGLPQVGVLDSGRYSSLHPGYYVVFSGIYGSSGQAETARAAAAEKGFQLAYSREITH